ncbi:immunoglobulin-like domain-containing protein [Catenovulum maritimum]|uniref:immunoglobulin-like domain-containing protein n=1 Tax=Catenovulum maritimum TaxID=1513271 RepID=UPI0006614A1F|nr:immunoglobulin-like domain-containing protein [Catenovulum maritimum]
MEVKFKLTMASLLILAATGCTDIDFSNDDPSTNQDTTPPIINLNGSNLIYISTNEIYVEQGASAIDENDGIVSVEMSGEVDANTPGSYVLNYIAKDRAGNESSLTRTVIVEDSTSDVTAPIVSLNGSPTINLTTGDIYSEEGATAVDNQDGPLTVVIEGNLDTSQAGTYMISYKATDAAGNESVIYRSVIVVDDIVTPEPIDNGYIFHSQNDSPFSFKYWGDTWGTETAYTDQPTNTDYAKSLEINKSSAWGTVVAWGNDVEQAFDISAYTHAKFKLKTDSFTSVQVFVQSASQPESAIEYNISSGDVLTNSWVEMTVPLPKFTDFTWLALNFKGDSGTKVLMSDLYFTTSDAVSENELTTSAPTPPSYSDADAIVLFSDALTQDSFIGVWRADWWNAPVYEQISIGDDNLAKYTITAGGTEGGIAGLEYGFEAGPLDASSKTHWNFDLYIESGISKVELQLVSSNGAAKYTLDTPTAEQWVSYSIPYADLVDVDGDGPSVLTPSSLTAIGIQLWGAANQSVYIDNIYFQGEASNYELSVTVTDSSNNPIAGANVSAGPDSATTDANGIALLNLAEGDHQVQVDSSGYGIIKQSQSIAGNDASVTISVNPLNPGPSVISPTPTHSNSEAIVLYSDALTVDKGISYWSDNWWNAPTFSEEDISGDKIAKFQIIPEGTSGGITGIQFGVENSLSLDASTATHLHFDMFATTGISQVLIQILAENGPGLYTLPAFNTGEWVSVDIPFSALTDSTGNFDPAKLTQLGLQLFGTTSDAVYLDNIYFY